MVHFSQATSSADPQQEKLSKATVNQNVNFIATDEDFPAVGAVRRKQKPKPKPVQAPFIEPAESRPALQPVAPAQDNSQRISGGVQVQQSSSGKSFDKQQVVNKWLKSVQQPFVKSQQLQTPYRTSGFTQSGCKSAPAAASQEQSPVQKVNKPPTPVASPSPSPIPSAMPSPSPTVARPEQKSPVTQSAPCPPNVSVSLPVGNVVPTAPEIRSMSGDDARVAVPINEPQSAQPTSRQMRRKERRMQREQGTSAQSSSREHRGLPAQLPEELLSPSSPGTENAPVDDDVSFMQELEQALADNSMPPESQLPLEGIAAHSTLNWNANEFCPNPNPVVIKNSRISERRRRQRFHRTLKPDALFELVSLPFEGLSPLQPEPQLQLQSQLTGSSQAPRATYTLSSSYSEASSAPVIARGSRVQPLPPMQHNSNYDNQSVFRLSSLPSTGIGTDGISGLPSTGIGTTGNSSLPSAGIRTTGNSSHNRSRSSRSGSTNTLSSASVRTVDGPNDASDNMLHSRPLLDMDPASQQTEAFLFLEPTNIDLSPKLAADKATNERNRGPRHLIFVKSDSPQRRNIEIDLNFMPPSIKKLYSLICAKYSDYAFVYALSAQLSQEFVPMECYVYLKMALLCSLASLEPDEMRPPISLCVICSDSYMANLMLHQVGQLAPRFIGPHEGCQEPVQHSALSLRHKWVMASPLLLAQQGVYYAGDWNCLTRAQSEELEKCIENGSVPVPQLQSEQPLEAAIWTYWQPENAANQATAFAKLCPIFGLPVHMGDQESNTLWDFVLNQHQSDMPEEIHDAFNIPKDDIRTMLTFLHQRQVTFTVEAEQLLQKYYVVSRIEQPTAFSSKTYIVLKQFAESIAKLSMRLDVLEADVAVAIFHSENFVRSIFGVGDFPPPAVVNLKVISRVDPYMNEFARWLYQYLDRYEDNMNDGGDDDKAQPKRQRLDSS
ncbi:uncharacterized protein LOC115564060 [Drosophila navojoa]|uniref:uncharacterized protein LOC115564060 n=1 Tax=Drosophila navojoa TaxID=7232 RepID=UPI00084736BB|nr:uncharacterized protein LOC115564060 [Drosophila navojoa]